MISFLTPQKLQTILPGNSAIDEWYEALVKILPDFNINTPKRVAAFLSQTAHESQNYTRLTENLNYSAKRLMEVWPKRFPNLTIANQYAKNPEKLGSFVYGNRLGNGPPETGDGYRYRGRGLIQLTGKSNYQEFADFIEVSLEEVVDYLETYDGAVHSACWFWQKNKLNSLSDVVDLRNLTIKINGGVNGLDDRINRYHNCLRALQQ